MKTNKTAFLISFALAIGLLAGYGLENSGDKKIDFLEKANFHTSIETKEVNNATMIHYKVKNISGHNQRLTFPTEIQADYVLYDQSKTKLRQLTDDIVGTEVNQEITLAQNEELSYGFTIENLTSGKYVLEVFLTAMEEDAKVLIDVIL